MLRLLVGALLVALIFAGGFAVSSSKTVTLTVDGTSTRVSTMKSRVIDIVQENGFSVGDRDDLYPAGDVTVPNAATIVLRRSRPLQITLDGQNSRQVWTTASTVDEALAQPAMTDTAPAAASRASRVPLAGMTLPVVSAKTVEIADGPVVRTVHLPAPNVAGLLAAAGARCRTATRWCRRPILRSPTACRSRSPVTASSGSPSGSRCRPRRAASKTRNST